VVRYRLELFAFLAAAALCRALPRRVVLGLGAALGRVAFRLDRRHRELALANYRRAFPEASAEETVRTIRDCFAFFGRYAFELAGCLPAFRAADLDRFEFEGLEHARAALAAGRGALCVTGHFGGWELQALAAGAQGWPLGVIVRPLDNPHLESRLFRLRTSSGNFVIDKREGFRPMLKALREGKGIAVLIDQNVIGDERIFVPFFGVPASTTPALGLLKVRTDAVILPVFAFPIAGYRWRLVVDPPVDVPPTGNRTEDVRRLTEACTRVLEDKVRAHPHLWLWMHNRWKTRP
jgi:Kdo2-lipid IVA lauroyltransferase/acyltransferase